MVQPCLWVQMPSVFLLAGARELVGETSPWLRSPHGPAVNMYGLKLGLSQSHCGLWDGLTLYPEASVLQSVQRETPPIQCMEAPSQRAARPCLRLPVSRLPWVLLVRPMERLRWLRLRNWEKEEAESMVFLRTPKAFVGNRNCV